jgi:hypothetical protein
MMKQFVNNDAKKYVAPKLEVFTLEHEAIMTTSGNTGNDTESFHTRTTIDRRRSLDE